MRMDENFLKYSALDSACTLEIHNSFWADLQGEFLPAYKLTIDLFEVLMFMQTRGVKVSHSLLEETKVDVLKSMAEKQRELDSLCGRPLNVNSPKDCQAYFYSELGIPVIKGKEGTPTVDDMALQRLVRGTVSRPGLRQAKLVQDIRGLGKLYGTYLNLEFDKDNRLRGSYNPRGTKFGRLSSSKTVFGTGTNFQNLPQEFKKFLVPDDGYCFVEVDKRQAEWVVVAYQTGDANMIAAIENGTDVHVHTASLMFSVPAEVVQYEHKLVGHTTDTDAIREIRLSDPRVSPHFSSGWPRGMSLRQCGKKSNHGLNYDEGPNGFALINEIDQSEAKRIVSMYHLIYPGIRIWYTWVVRELQKSRTLTNCFGRTVRFMGMWNDKLWKSAYSMLPQSTVVDSLNKGLISIYNDAELCGAKGYNIDVLAQVHDSVLMQIPIEVVRDRMKFENMINKVIDYTSPDITATGRTFKIASDFKFGMNWGGEHKDRNPLGMVECDTHEEFIRLLKGWEDVAGTTGMAQ